MDMKKRWMMLLLAAVSAVMMTGCGGGGDDYYEPGPEPVTLFLLDHLGYSYGGIPYRCDGMINWAYTRPNGEFTFYEYESCEFDFGALHGNYANDPFSGDEVVRITDDLNIGVPNIRYECRSYGPGKTDYDGAFYYDSGDICTFFFEGIW